MAIYNKRAKFTRAQLLGHYLKRDSIADLIYGIVRILGIIIQNLYCVSSYLVLSWIVLLPISWFKSELYSKAENYLYNSLLFIVSSWSLTIGATVVETGEEYKHLIEESGEESDASGIQEDALDAEDDLEINHNKVDGRRKLHLNRIDNKRALEEDSPLQKRQQHLKSKNSNIRNYQQTNGYTRYMNHNGTLEEPEFLVDGDSDTALTRSGLKTKLRNASQPTITNGLADDCQVDCMHEKRNGFHQLDTAHNLDEVLNNNNNDVNINNNIENHSNQIVAKTKLKNCNLANGANAAISSSKRQRQQSIERSLSASNDNLLQLKYKQAKPRVLLLCNHISTADVPLMMQSFSTLTKQSLLWVLDAQFKPTNFGVVCSSHGDFFVEKNSFIEGTLREQVLKHPDRNLLVLFPEGGFLRKRLEGSNRYATRQGLPLTKYVTHPRFGAFKDLIDPSVGVTHIVDATLLYDDIKNPLSILDIVLGTRKEPAILNYKVYKRSEINPTEEWLRSIWLDKDKLMTKFYEDRASFYKQIEDSMRVAQIDWFKVLAVHLFYLLVCYLVIFRLFCATNVTMLKARELYYSNI